jgi:hypothetical protein
MDVPGIQDRASHRRWLGRRPTIGFSDGDVSDVVSWSYPGMERKFGIHVFSKRFFHTFLRYFFVRMARRGRDGVILGRNHR